MTKLPSICVLGAGTIGCYVGGLLATQGHKVKLIGRRNSGQQLVNTGFALSTLDGASTIVSPKLFSWHDNPEALRNSEVILLCTKCPATRAAAVEINKFADPGAIVISLQNGIGNIETLNSILTRQTVLTGMVSYNVVKIDEKTPRFHQATDGVVVIEENPASIGLCQSLAKSGNTAFTSKTIENVVWGKMLLNLNNAINVLSGLPLKAQLQQRAYRQVMAQCISEALDVLAASGIKPEKIAKVSPEWLPTILRLPDFIFHRIAKSMLNMDEKARTSMWADLQNGRESEVDYLNGAVSRLGESLNVATPVNDVVVQLTKQTFVNGSSPNFSGKMLLKQVGLK